MPCSIYSEPRRSKHGCTDRHGLPDTNSLAIATAFLLLSHQTMNTLRAALIPGIIAGVLSVLGSWFWMGFVFHRYQRATPETWRPEGPRHYLLSSLVRLV